MSSQRIFIVTGANKGIGYAIVCGLAEKAKGALIYLTARNESLGQESLKKAVEQLGTKRQSDIRYHQLDITDEASCKRLAEDLKQEHGGIDVLVNNAGFAFKRAATETPAEQAEVTIGLNYYGTKLVSKHLIPLIRDGGRIVNVCSQLGVMTGKYADKWIDLFKKGEYTEADIDNFVEQFKKAAKEDNIKAAGFDESSYGVSKAAEIALTLLHSKELKPMNITVNGCCPGYVDSDMSSHKGPLTTTEGADTPIFLAINESAHNGQFVHLRKAIEWL